MQAGKLIILLMLLAVGLGACGTRTVTKVFGDPTAHAANLATIESVSVGTSVVVLYGFMPFPTKTHNVRIRSIDDEPIRHGDETKPVYRVASGNRTFTVLYVYIPKRTFGIIFYGGASAVSGRHGQTYKLKFRVEAQRKYQVYGTRVSDQNWVWIEDAATKKVVAGTKPPISTGVAQKTTTSTPPERKKQVKQVSTEATRPTKTTSLPANPQSDLRQMLEGKTWSMSYAFGLNETVVWRIELQKKSYLVGNRKRMLRLGYEVGSDRDIGRWWTKDGSICMQWVSWAQGQAVCYRITCSQFNCVAVGPRPFSGKFFLK